MKKAKVMLLTIAVMASVGTALAFKAHKFGNDTYCYLTTTQQPTVGQCTDEISGAQALPTGSGVYFQLKPANGCSEAACEAKTSGFID